MDILRRAAATEGTGLEFVLSDGSLDRHGTRINPDGWVLDNFRKNAIALFNHDRDAPIGVWESVRTEAGKLIARLKPAARGTSARLDEIVSLVEQGVLRATSVGFTVLEAGVAGKSKFDFEKQELLEASIVAVGSNPNALAKARALNISGETLSLVFGEIAAKGTKTASEPGKHPAKTLPVPRTKSMQTLSERIVDAQNDLTAKRDKLAELSAADNLDVDAIEALNVETEASERTLAALKATEARIGTAAPQPSAIVAPAIARGPLGVRQREVKASDLIVRAAVCHLLAHVQKQPVERILEERYPGHEATAAITRADIVVATTTTSGWASQLVETAMAEFLALLPATAIYPQLRNMGLSLTFGPNSGAIKVPFTSTNAALAGGFVLEGDPIPVGRLTLDSTTLTPHKFGIIVPMTREVMRYTTPALEAVVRGELLNRTAITLDGILLDSTAASTTRPAGLLNGVSVAGSSYGGGDYTAFLEDMKTLLAPFDTANAGRKLALIMNPAQARHIRMMPGPNSSGFGWANQFLADFQLIVSTSATAGTVIAVDTADFVTGTGDAPQFEASEQATIHMSDTPLEIVSGTGPTTADPVRSMFQTNSVALRMLMNVTWAMRRTGMVQYLSGTSW